MSYREVFDADSRSDLIMNDTVGARRQNAQRDDLSVFHEKRMSMPNDPFISTSQQGIYRVSHGSVRAFRQSRHKGARDELTSLIGLNLNFID